MGTKASETGDWLQQIAGKRDRREVSREDDFVVRPGPNFDWFMGSLATGQPAPAAPDGDPASHDRHEDDPRREVSR